VAVAGQLVGLAQHHKAHVELQGQAHPDQKSASLHAGDEVDLGGKPGAAQLVRHELEGLTQASGISKQRRDVPEQDARARKIRHRANEALEMRHLHTVLSSRMRLSLVLHLLLLGLRLV
jgi:hypothetical protein